MNDREILDIINKAAFEVRCRLNSGYLESVYQNALVIELKLLGLRAEKEVQVPVYYKNNLVGDFRVDILVENRIIIELKAVREILPIHEAQLVNYLVATGFNNGVLINYGGDKFSYREKTREYLRPKSHSF